MKCSHCGNEVGHQTHCNKCNKSIFSSQIESEAPIVTQPTRPSFQPNPAQYNIPIEDYQNNEASPKNDVSFNFSSYSKHLIAFSYVPTLFWLGLIEKSKEGKFAANQGFYALITSICIGVLISVFQSMFNFIGIEFISFLFGCTYTLFLTATIIYSVIGIIKAYQFERLPFPVLGKIKIFK